MDLIFLVVMWGCFIIWTLECIDKPRLSVS